MRPPQHGEDGTETEGFRPLPEYRPDLPTRDEAWRDGDVRPAWREIFDACRAGGVETLNNWNREISRFSRERGLAYHFDVSGSGWSLDPIPWILSSEDWAGIEAGIVQRMRLYEALFRDIYGDQVSLVNRRIPSRLVLGDRGFVRSLRRASENRSLNGMGMAAIDIARTSQGGWVVVNDRFDSPFGLGQALENRTVINQVLPDLFRKCQTRRIGQFFADWFTCVAEGQARRIERPRVVILDCDGEESSESNFLANYCRLPLVSEADLTVRDGAVWLKALSGLEPVHAIWNRGTGNRLDSLEGEPGGHGGLPGAFEALRLGNVSIASHPGAKVLQNPGLYPSLDALCEEFLGESLLIPTVKTWWAGERASLQFILDNLPRLVIKKVEGRMNFKTRYGRLLSSKELAELRAMIESEPDQFVGEEELEISTLPAYQSGALHPHRAVLRAFSFVDQQGQPRVMPGGLGRLGRADGSIVSTRTGGSSKDIWVRSDRDNPPFSIADEVEQLAIRSRQVVTSRSGENLFWAGRYAERTDSIARFAIRLIESEVIGFSYGRKMEKKHESQLFHGLFEILEMGENHEEKDGFREWVRLLLVDPNCPASVSCNLESFHRACHAARGEWSPRSLHVIQTICEEWSAGSGETLTPFGYRAPLERLEQNLAAFVGLNLDSMTRHEGWALLDSGRALERCVVLCGLLRLVIRANRQGSEETLWCESLLFVTDSLRTYQTRFLAAPRIALAAELLLGEDDYPRSMRFLLRRMKTNLARLPREDARDRVVNRIAACEEVLERFLPGTGAGGGGNIDWAGAGLMALEEISENLKGTSDELTRAYFSHATTWNHE